MRKTLLLIACLCSFLTCFSQEGKAPVREFRAAWIATVANIDWPSRRDLSVDQQKQEILYLFDRLQKNNFNAVIVQIRPVADAFYDSPYEAWSKYLTGKQGVAPTPYYDPLKFMIEEAHKRCLEFHAWVNPYRALMSAYRNDNPSSHVTKQHPNWFVNYGKKKYFNPGLPEVRNYTLKVMRDIVKRYDIDALHMDDYFYPYRIGKTEFPDLSAYRRYNKNNLSRDDWRRENVNVLVRELNRVIKQTKPHVKFGISPFGVWRNSDVDSIRGSNTTAGQTNYDDLFADVILWQKNGWIDYSLPQLYWETGHKAVDYNTLIKWWNDNAFDRHMYIGHAIYKLKPGKTPWHNLDEIDYQIKETRRYPKIQGSAFYSAKFFRKNIFNINHYFEHDIYKKPALLPEMPWLNSEKPKPIQLQINYSQEGVRLIKWLKSDDPNAQYAVYKIVNGRHEYSKDLVKVTADNYYVITGRGSEEYGVTALNRHHVESEMSNLVR